jgi:hypothetical protein
VHNAHRLVLNGDSIRKTTMSCRRKAVSGFVELLSGLRRIAVRHRSESLSGFVRLRI